MTEVPSPPTGGRAGGRPLVFVFTHDENGVCNGAGSIEGFDPSTGMALIRPGGIGFSRLVPLAQTSDFPQHPGYWRLYEPVSDQSSADGSIIE